MRLIADIIIRRDYALEEIHRKVLWNRTDHRKVKYLVAHMLVTLGSTLNILKTVLKHEDV